MKVYVLTEKDFEELLANLELSQFRFTKGDEQHEAMYQEIHRRFRYLIVQWMDEVKK